MSVQLQTQYLTQDTETQPIVGLATLMTLAYTGADADLASLGKRLLDLAAIDNAEALMDLSTLVQLKGDTETGIALQSQALAMQQLFHLRPEHEYHDMNLLAIMAPGDLMSNTPLEFLAEGAGLNLDLLYLSPSLSIPKRLPEHDIAIVAVSELDRNRATLNMIETALPVWPRPILNRPQSIASMARDRTSVTLGSVPGLTMPLTVRISREVLQQIANKAISIQSVMDTCDFPVIIRPVDSHAGKGLSRIEAPHEITQYLTSQTAHHFFLSRYIDYRSEDGLFRKYRIIVINGKPLVVHMAVSEHWMIHYLNAGMADCAHKRSEEAKAMASFDAGFAHRHATALQAVYNRLGLDYFGIDCAETMDGKLLIFEVGNSMVVHNMDPIEQFPYKDQHMQRVFRAFRAMLSERIECHTKEQAFKILS